MCCHCLLVMERVAQTVSSSAHNRRNRVCRRAFPSKKAFFPEIFITMVFSISLIRLVGVKLCTVKKYLVMKLHSCKQCICTYFVFIYSFIVILCMIRKYKFVVVVSIYLSVHYPFFSVVSVILCLSQYYCTSLAMSLLSCLQPSPFYTPPYSLSSVIAHILVSFAVSWHFGNSRLLTVNFVIIKFATFEQ